MTVLTYLRERFIALLCGFGLGALGFILMEVSNNLWPFGGMMVLCGFVMIVLLLVTGNPDTAVINASAIPGIALVTTAIMNIVMADILDLAIHVGYLIYLFTSGTALCLFAAWRYNRAR